MTEQYQLPWQDPDWMKHAHAWIHAEAQRHSIHVTGEIEQPHLYPWSTVLTVPAEEGRLFFKATALETIFEAALTQKLAEWQPDCMPELVSGRRARLDADARWRRAASPFHTTDTGYPALVAGNSTKPSNT